MNARKITILILLIALATITGCKKQFDQEENPSVEPTSMEDLRIVDGFDWKLTENIRVNISSEQPRIMRITSDDDQIIYYKGFHQGQNENLSVTINIPKSVGSVYINNDEMPISGKILSYSFPSKKSLLTTNKSVYFDGTAYCEIQDITALNNASAFTVSAWVKQTNTTAYARLFHKFLGHGQDISVATYMSKFYIEVGNGSNTYAYWPDYATTISNDTWYHFAAVYDGTQANSNDRIKLYINGSPVSLNFNGTIPATTYAFPAGTYQFLSWDQKMNGKMDEVRIWNYARSQTEINNDMNNTLDGTQAGFLAYYKFDELSLGYRCADASGHHSDAMLFAGFSLSTDVPFSYVVDTDGDGIPDSGDDYPTDPTRAFDNYFPAAGYGSLAFEDLWPGKGDYDFNDVVVDYRFHTVTNALNSVVEIFATFPVKASGAYLHNGFGFNLPEASGAFTGNPWKLSVTGYDIQEGYVTLNAYGHEAGQTKPTIIVFDDIFNLLPHPGLGLGVNTEEGPPQVAYDTVVITMEPNGVFSQANFSLTTWNPFIMVDQTRGHEVHLPDYPPTDLVDNSKFGMWEDDSDPLTDRYYKTETNLPWAIDIPAEFDWPIEKQEITGVYLHFAEWAESGGTAYNDWYENNPGYRDDSKIYSP